MISIEDRTEWAKAEQKARQMKAHVKMVSFGTYEVPSSNPANPPYTVTFTKTATGHWAASCTCKAHVGDGRPDYQPRRCWHIPTGYHAHRIQVNIRKQLRASSEEAPAAAPVCAVCNADANAWTGSEWLCWPHLLERAAEEDQAEANAIETEAELDSVREMNYTDEQAAKDYSDIFG